MMESQEKNALKAEKKKGIKFLKLSNKLKVTINKRRSEPSESYEKDRYFEENKRHAI